MWCMWDVFKFVLMHLHEQWACLRQFMTVVQKFAAQCMLFQTARWFEAGSTVYGCVLHYRWSGVASQTKVHLSQGGTWHAVHKPSQDLATRNNTCADFPFSKTPCLWGRVNFSRDLKHDRMLLCTIQKTWKANEPEKHGKTIKRRRNATLETLQTWKWICAGAHFSPQEMLVEMSPREMVVLALQEFSQQILQRPQIGIVCLRISSNCNLFHRPVTFIIGGLHLTQYWTPQHMSLIVSNWHLQLQGHDHDLSPAQLSYAPRMWGHGKVIPRCQIQSHTSTLPLHCITETAAGVGMNLYEYTKFNNITCTSKW